MKAKVKSKTVDFILLNIGTLLVAFGVYFFKFPNNFSTGGVSGISIIVAKYLPNVSAGTLVFILNTVLLLIGLLVFGKKFGIKTAYSSMLFSVSISLLERFFPMNKPFTDEPLLELIFAVALPAFGSAILFNMNASTGGTDIVAMLLKKYTSINIGRALLLSDAVITLLACVAFGMKTGLFSILGLIIKSLVVDVVIENINLCKYFTIITVAPEPICDFINKNLKRGATIADAVGAFTHMEKKIIFTVINRHQALLLRNYVKSVDPNAFIMITNTSEIIGKGFRGIG